MNCILRDNFIYSLDIPTFIKDTDTPRWLHKRYIIGYKCDQEVFIQHLDDIIMDNIILENIFSEIYDKLSVPQIINIIKNQPISEEFIGQKLCDKYYLWDTLIDIVSPDIIIKYFQYIPKEVVDRISIGSNKWYCENVNKLGELLSDDQIRNLFVRSMLEDCMGSYYKLKDLALDFVNKEAGNNYFEYLLRYYWHTHNIIPDIYRKIMSTYKDTTVYPEAIINTLMTVLDSMCSLIYIVHTSYSGDEYICFDEKYFSDVFNNININNEFLIYMINIFYDKDYIKPICKKLISQKYNLSVIEKLMLLTKGGMIKVLKIRNKNDQYIDLTGDVNN